MESGNEEKIKGTKNIFFLFGAKTTTTKNQIDLGRNKLT